MINVIYSLRYVGNSKSFYTCFFFSLKFICSYLCVCVCVYVSYTLEYSMSTGKYLFAEFERFLSFCFLVKTCFVSFISCKSETKCGDICQEVEKNFLHKEKINTRYVNMLTEKKNVGSRIFIRNCERNNK